MEVKKLVSYGRAPRQAKAKDKVKAENDLLKLELEPEHGMEEIDTSELQTEIEYQWLTRIQNFEEQYKDANQIKVYDFLGRPAFRKADELKPGEIEAE